MFFMNLNITPIFRFGFTGFDCFMTNVLVNKFSNGDCLHGVVTFALNSNVFLIQQNMGTMDKN